VNLFVDLVGDVFLPVLGLQRAGFVNVSRGGVGLHAMSVQKDIGARNVKVRHLLFLW
jgi:hypothetical protein